MHLLEWPSTRLDISYNIYESNFFIYLNLDFINCDKVLLVFFYVLHTVPKSFNN